MSDPAHVVYVVHADGANATVTRNLGSLIKLGLPVTLLGWDRFCDGGAKVKRVPGVDYRYIFSGGGMKQGTSGRLMMPWWRAVIGAARKIRTSFFYASGFQSAVPVWFLTRFLRRPYVYHIHDNISTSFKFDDKMRRRLDRMDLKLIRDAALVVVPGEDRIYPYAEPFRAHIQVIPNVYPETAPPPPPRALDTPFTLLLHGSLQKVRGAKLVLDATRDIEGIRLIVAGQLPESDVEEALQAHPFAEYRGFLDGEQATALYAEADLVCMLYDPDLEINRTARPMKYGEALRAGRAVLMNDEVALSEEVRREAVGFTCGYDVGQVRNLILRLRDSRSEVQTCATRGRELYERKYQWQIYEEILLRRVQEACGLMTAPTSQ
jgi:glycosyltransferase involved in cell wall biosynthesis